MKPLRSAIAVLLAASLVIGARNAHALDPESTDALNQTLQALQDESGRPGAIPGVTPGSELDRALQKSPELKKELYDVAGQAFREMAEETGGDVGAMSGTVERGRSDPAAFEQSLSSGTRERVHALAAKIEDGAR